MNYRLRPAALITAAALVLGLLGLFSPPALAATPGVRLKLTQYSISAGQSVELQVTVRRGAPRQKVVLQRKRGTHWVWNGAKLLPGKGRIKRIAFSITRYSEGTFTYRVKLGRKGDTNGVKSGSVRLRVLAANSASPTSPPSTSPVATPLKFNLSGATGLALAPAASFARLGRTATTRNAETMIVSADGSASNLDVVTSSGETREAVVSGSAAIQEFLIAPNGQVYILFRGRVNLADTATYGPGGCLLAEVNTDTGLPSCIDSTMSSINWPQDSMPANPAIQFDASGAIYYWGWNSSGNAVLRRYYAGVTTDLINDNVWLKNFLALPDGSVIVAGVTRSTEARWTRRVTPQAGLQSLFNNDSFLGLARFADGNVYFFDNYDNYHVRRFLTATSEVDPQVWLSAPSWPTVDTKFPCPQYYNCSGMHMNKTAQTADGSVFAIDNFATVSGQNQRQPLKIFPTVAAANLSGVRNVNLLQGAGNYVIASGVDGNGANVLTRYDASGGAETQLLGPSNQIEIYHLNPTNVETKLWFDGLRFSDNRVVVGQIDVPTGQISILNTLSGKWEDFQTFAP